MRKYHSVNEIAPVFGNHTFWCYKKQQMQISLLVPYSRTNCDIEVRTTCNINLVSDSTITIFLPEIYTQSDFTSTD